ncbi:hypothetical protein [Herbidospora daliensis]|uniref:hypothetical protein n=1 Tax=Herbidospora daliensis TaxID=295585 RepID=UPI0012FBEBCF|nr:hypothetical protein [Herbidospora daliensis]
MAMVEPHDIRSLLASEIPDAALVVDDGRVRIVSEEHAHHAAVVVTKQTLVDKLDAGGMTPDQLTDDHVKHMAAALDQIAQKPGV